MNTSTLTKEQKLEWKRQLKTACIKILEQRSNTINQAMKEAQEAANNEEKSSAGDKYETSRAMGHLSQEMQSNQLEEAKHELGIINTLNTEVLCEKAGFGALVICKDFTFFIALGLGTTMVNGQKMVLLSPQAPIANLLYHKKAGDSFVFNAKTTLILDLF
jgi:transcription elongation GreA/GreB family factor